MAAPNSPRVDIQIILEPTTFTFGEKDAPKITLELRSHAEHPITIYTWSNALNLRHGLANSQFVITDLTTNEPVKTSRVMIQRCAQMRTKGGPDDGLFLTLTPAKDGKDNTIRLSDVFGRPGFKPQPREVAQRGWELDENGKEMRIRRSQSAIGVDGLEPGRSYNVGLNMESLGRCLWAPLDREEILVEPGSTDAVYLQDCPWEKEAVIDFHVTEASLGVRQG